MNVLQVSAADVGGGAEKVAADIHRACLARGISSTLAVGHRFADIEGTTLIPNDEMRGSWARAILKRLPELSGPGELLSPWQRRRRRLTKAVAEPGRAWRRSRGYEDFDYPGTSMLPRLGTSDFDVMHLHNLHGGYFDLRCLPELTKRLPSLMTLHDTWTTSGHCAYTMECPRWQTGCGECPRPWILPSIPRDKSAQNWALKKQLFERSRLHIVGPSEWILGHARRSILQPAAASYSLIPNGVDQAVFRPGSRVIARQKLGLALEPLVLLFSAASEANPYKDFTAIRDALPLIVARVAPRDLIMIVLGHCGDAESIGRCRVVPVPYLKDAREVATYLQAADLYIHAAKAENHPLAILEAQSCGLPVVASRVGGIPEAMDDGITGLLFPPGDSGSLAEQASSLLLDDARRAEMSGAAAELARGRFSLDRMVDDYLALYERIRATG